MATTQAEENDNERNVGSPHNYKKRPFYFNWQIWLVVLLSLSLILSACLVAFGSVAVFKVLSEPGTYAAIVVIATIVGSTFAGLLKAFAPVWEELKKIRAEAEVIKVETESAKIKADVAESTVKQLDVDTSERASLLERRYEALSRQYVNITQMAERLADNLQEEQARSEAKISRLEEKLEKVTQQNNDRQIEIANLKEDHRREVAEMRDAQRLEVAELREQLRAMGRESTSDKQEIAVLRQRVNDLELEMKKVKLENEHLSNENRELKTGARRRSTDHLPPLPETDNGSGSEG